MNCSAHLGCIDEVLSLVHANHHMEAAGQLESGGPRAAAQVQSCNFTHLACMQVRASLGLVRDPPLSQRQLGCADRLCTCL